MRGRVGVGAAEEEPAADMHAGCGGRLGVAEPVCHLHMHTHTAWVTPGGDLTACTRTDLAAVALARIIADLYPDQRPTACGPQA